MSRIRCQKCGAGPGSLEPRVEHVATGEVLQVVRCMICSWRIEKTVHAAPVDRDEAKVDKQRSIPDPQTFRAAGAKGNAAMQASRLPCAVRDCPGTYVPTHSKSKLCRDHRLQLERWRQRQPSTPPPIALVNGHWIKRGEPLPGDRGENPTFVDLPPAQPEPVEIVPSDNARFAFEPPAELTAALFKSARRGHTASRALLAALEGA